MSFGQAVGSGAKFYKLLLPLLLVVDAPVQTIESMTMQPAAAACYLGISIPLALM